MQQLKIHRNLVQILSMYEAQLVRSNMKPTSARTIDLKTIATRKITLPAGSFKRSVVVPIFLYKAFQFLEHHDYRKMEGIFRKEGVNSRVTEAEDCLIDGNIPDTMTVIEVCVLVKRFFKYIDGGIFGDKENDVLNWCFDSRGEILSNPVGLWTYLNTLHPTYFGSLVFLVFNLHKIIRDAENNKMTATNLALMFAPVLFIRSLYNNGNHTISAPELCSKARLEEERRRLVHVIVLMIDNHEKLLTLPPMFKPNRNSGRLSSRGNTPDRRASCRSASVDPSALKLPAFTHAAAPNALRPAAMEGRLPSKTRRFNSFHRLVNVFKPLVGGEQARIRIQK
ncbi:hypothetical protein M3Y98_00171700 [Aphelenchoides besseyi]|nr:hypothetical protein M3Y98_00171700 [Aphelenchoides besseyi]